MTDADDAPAPAPAAPTEQPLAELATVRLPRPAEASNLISDLLRSPLDPGYADAARRRAEVGPRVGWRSTTAKGALLVAMVLLGLLLAVAYRQVVVGEPASTKARADLLADIRAKRKAADTSQREADRLREDVTRENDAALSGDENAALLKSKAAVAGTGKLKGAGTSVELADATAQVDPVTGKVSDDNPGVVLDRDLQDVANALWQAGAEGIAINGQRLTATTAIRAAGGAILVDFRPITSPYRVVAIGPSSLTDRFNSSATARQFRRYVTKYRMKFSTRKEGNITLPAAPESRLRYAHAPLPSVSAASGSASGVPGSAPSGKQPPSSGGPAPLVSRSP